MDTILDNLAFGVLVLMLLALLIGGASALGNTHSAERKACIEAGYEWGATQYVCKVKLPKK